VRAAAKTRCPSCGSSTTATAEFCQRCGNDLTSPGALPLLALRDDPAERTEVIEEYRGDEVRAAGPGRPAGRRPLLGALLAVVGLTLVAAGGYGGYRALVERRAAPSGVTAPPPAASPNARTTLSSRPTRGTATTGPAPLVAPAPALAGRPETAEVVRLLTRYFDAINTRNFAASHTTLVDRPGLPKDEAEFQDQYRSTHDEDVRLLNLRPDGEGGYLASVSFTSYQNPADAPADTPSPCLVWSMAYPLARVDGTLLIDEIGRSSVAYRRC
jgi:hypothetical protein